MERVTVNIPDVARFAFGHGLAYDDIACSAFALGSPTLAWNGRIMIRATVANKGSRTAEEVSQFYAHNAAASITQPVRLLRGYRTIKLAPGVSRAIEPGPFHGWIAPPLWNGGVLGVFMLMPG